MTREIEMSPDDYFKARIAALGLDVLNLPGVYDAVWKALRKRDADELKWARQDMRSADEDRRKSARIIAREFSEEQVAALVGALPQSCYRDVPQLLAGYDVFSAKFARKAREMRLSSHLVVDAVLARAHAEGRCVRSEGTAVDGRGRWSGRRPSPNRWAQPNSRSRAQ